MILLSCCACGRYTPPLLQRPTAADETSFFFYSYSIPNMLMMRHGYWVERTNEPTKRSLPDDRPALRTAPQPDPPRHRQHARPAPPLLVRAPLPRLGGHRGDPRALSAPLPARCDPNPPRPLAGRHRVPRRRESTRWRGRVRVYAPRIVRRGAGNQWCWFPHFSLVLCFRMLMRLWEGAAEQEHTQEAQHNLARGHVCFEHGRDVKQNYYSQGEGVE